MVTQWLEELAGECSKDLAVSVQYSWGSKKSMTVSVFFTSSRNPKSVPQACMADTLTTEHFHSI